MNAGLKKFLSIFSFVHKICPLCVMARKFPRSRYARVLGVWQKVCPFCTIYRVTR
ncbi:MAG: hypothetical protein JW734_00705 [Candidatus Omnitrophica bacterium]|nr:hypothetical protein [Candidatus Omnitrophota bacterium]